MISPKQAFYVLSLYSLLVAPLASAQTPAIVPTSTLAAPTTLVTRASSIRAGGAPFPIGDRTGGFGTGTGVGTGIHGSTGIIGTGTGAPFPTGTGVSGGGKPAGENMATPDGKPGLAVWWGQSTDALSLGEQCDAPDVDVIIVSFVTSFNAKGGFPEFKLTTGEGPSPAQQAAGAESLIDGSKHIDELKKCQENGKKVYISLGGQTGKVIFKSDEEAQTAATQLSELFLTSTDPELEPLRPFGDFVMDGVDFDMENKNPEHYVAFTEKLREMMDAGEKGKFQIGAAPQCPREGQPNNQDASLPDDVLKLTDHVWVQFYNNEPCSHGMPGFSDSVKEWSQAIAPARLWVGAPGAEEGADSGYIDPAAIEQEIQEVKGMNLPNFGGYALWDGPIAQANDKYDSVVKKALQG